MLHVTTPVSGLRRFASCCAVMLVILLGTRDARAQTHVGSSPFPPPEEGGTNFVSDVGPSLDQGCTYRDFGPRRITVDVRRYVGEVNSSGFLSNPSQLIANGVVSAKARIRLPAWDIDYDAVIPDYEPERDRITFNGKDLGFLTGTNNTWKLNEFEVPIEWVKFPQRGADGSLPAPAHNEIRIDIDVANTVLVWCMDVDWVEISFEAMAPLILVHGTSSQAEDWDGAFIDRLTTLSIPFSRNINMPQGGNGTIDGNARFLATRVQALAKSFGAKRVHLVAHSKGGLDSRQYLYAYADPNTVKVLSLYTLATPHSGTILADLSSAHRNLNDPQSDDPDISSFFGKDWWLDRFNVGPQDPALTEQTVPNMATYNRSHPYTSTARFYNLAASADLNNNHQIDAGEPIAPLVNILGIPNLVHRLLGNMAGITVTRRTNLFGLNEWHEVDPIPTGSFQRNDLVVTAASAHHPSGVLLGGIQDASHGTIKSTQAADLVVNRIKQDFPLQ